MIYDLGKFILTPRGTYSASTIYYTLDIVLFNGSSYVCKVDGTQNVTPTNAIYWQLLALSATPTMTEEQKQEIIQTLLAQGVVIDSNYNTFTTAEKQKLAGLSAPQNGTLAINYNNSRLGTFTANQSGNTTVNIPSPADGVITLVRADNEETIDKFHVNQRENQTIKLPMGSGSGGGTGTIYVYQGSNIITSFTLADNTDTTVTIPNNTLTLKKNNTPIGTYTPAANSTLNITVPTSANDLDDGEDVKMRERIVTPETEDIENEHLTDDGYILKLKPNYIYTTAELTAFRIEALDFTAEYPYMVENFPSYVVLDAADDFDITLPSGCFLCGSTALAAGEKYILTVKGQFFKIDRYEEIR